LSPGSTLTQREIDEALDALNTELARQGLQAEEAFSRFDRNRDGYLQRSEFDEAFSSMRIPITQLQVTGIFDYLDTDRNGRVSINEFLRHITGAQQTHG
jgi:Ca2+-binding EF-hand superfamily protein